jgi:hypothetical protein
MTLSSGFPFLPLVLNFGIHFLKFFCIENELRNVLFEIFDEFELEKIRKIRSKIFVPGKIKILELKRVMRGEENIS